MNCLTDVEVQTVVDDEATPASLAHAAECRRCRERIDERRRELALVSALVTDDGEVPPGPEARVRAAVTSGQAVRGATTLRASGTRSWRRAGWISALATAGALAAFIFVVLPRFGSPTTLSAAEVLGRSLQTLSGSRGIELLEYDLSINGMTDGPHRIEHLIDREHPNRYRLSNFGPDGVLRSAISQDPSSGRRTHLARVDGRNYIIRVTSIKDPVLSLPQMAQAHVEAVIAMMQATADQKLTVLNSAEGTQYLIEIPRMTPRPGSTFDVSEARVLVDGTDFHIREFDASGTMLKQPYSVSFKLLRRVQLASASAAEFEIAAAPDDVVVEGAASGEPFDDVVSVVLRELGRTKRQ